MQFFKSSAFRSCLRGSSNIAYSLVTGLVAVISIGAVSGTGGAVIGIFETAVDELSGGGKANENASENGQENSGNSVPDIIDVIVPPDGEYFPGDKLTFTIVFSKKVNVKEGAYIQIDIGGEIRHATYVSGSHTTDIVFEYVITEDDLDPDGIELPQTEIEGGDGDGGEDSTDPVEGGDGDFGGKDPDTGGIIVPGPKKCTVRCAYIGLGNGKLMKLADDGSVIWEKSSISGGVAAIAVDPASGVYAAGDRYVKKYDFDGNLLWSRMSGFGAIRALTVTADGDVVAGAELWGNVFSYSSTGSYQGTNDDTKTEEGYYPGMDVVTGLAPAATGNAVYAVSQYGQFTKINIDTMETEWSTRTLSRYLNGVAASRDGFVYPAGWDVEFEEMDGFSYEYVYQFEDLNPGYFLLDGWEHSGAVRHISVSDDGLIALSTRATQPFERNYTFAFRRGQDAPIFKRIEAGPVNETAFDADGNLWIGLENGSLRVRNQSGVQIGYTYRFESPIRAIAINKMADGGA